MNNNFKLNIFLVSLLVPTILTSIIFSFIDNEYYDYLSNTSNKTVLFIGDGLGENHIEVAEQKLGYDLFFTNFEKEGYVKTNSLTMFAPTDSAAAGTALATGQKVFNRQIAYHNEKKVLSICEILKQKGFGVGIITSDYLSGATPSGFSSHAKDRDDEHEIIKNQIISNIDLFLGRKSDTYDSYIDDIEKNGYHFIDEVKELTLSNDKIFGAFDKINNYNHEENRPTLPMLMDYAIDYFEMNYPNGYFIMCEQAYIDKRSHDNNISSMIRYLDEFDNTIELTYNKLKKENPFLLVTADHETGDLRLPNENEEITDDLYNSKNHTAKNVKYFISHENDNINKIKKEIDNTHIFRIYDAIYS